MLVKKRLFIQRSYHKLKVILIGIWMIFVFHKSKDVDESDFHIFHVCDVKDFHMLDFIGVHVSLSFTVAIITFKVACVIPHGKGIVKRNLILGVDCTTRGDTKAIELVVNFIIFALKVPHAKVIDGYACPSVEEAQLCLLRVYVIFSFAKSKSIRAGFSIFEEIINLQFIFVIVAIAFVSFTFIVI